MYGGPVQGRVALFKYSFKKLGAHTRHNAFLIHKPINTNKYTSHLALGPNDLLVIIGWIIGGIIGIYSGRFSAKVHL